MYPIVILNYVTDLIVLCHVIHVGTLLHFIPLLHVVVPVV